MNAIEIDRNEVEPMLVVMHAAVHGVKAMVVKSILPPVEKRAGGRGVGHREETAIVGACQQDIELARTPRSKQQLQVDRLKKFKAKNARKAEAALNKLADIVETDENCFPALLEAAEVCSLGQISERLQEVVGRFRPMV